MIGSDSPVKAQPLLSVQELLDWQPGSRAIDALCRGKQRLTATQVAAAQKRRQGPQLLICHDLQGGYGDDSLVQGGADPEQFSIYAWHLIDIFVYFSHWRVSIPPPSWIDAAHLHGVSVLGTFITEWEEGALECMQLLASKTTARLAAEQLAIIACYYRFDGWLINIENAVSLTLMPNLLLFLRYLRESMHAAVPGSRVIWYDAVTSEGILQWQDSLTELNRPFFDECDGLFVNYTWKAGTPVQASASAGPGQSAGVRHWDVFMGIDVFGRGTYAGGGFNSYVALETAADAGLSTAVFAPGWVWEDANPRTAWRTRSQQFWDGLQAAMSEVVRPRAVAVELPFHSSFDRGSGLAMYAGGKLQSAQPWFNLSRQGVQPLFQDRYVTRLSHKQREGPAGRLLVSLTVVQASVSEGKACDGGCYLAFEGQLAASQRVDIPIFSTAIRDPLQPLEFAFKTRSSNSGDCRFLLLLCLEYQSSAAGCSDSGTETEIAFPEVARPQPTREWVESRHEIGKGQLKGATICSIAARIESSAGCRGYSCHLGEVNLAVAGSSAGAHAVGLISRGMGRKSFDAM